MKTRSFGVAIAFLTATRLVVNSAHRFVFPFLPAISRGLGISLAQGGLLMSARSIAFVATPAIVASAGRGERRVRLGIWALGMMSVGALITAATGVYAGALVGFILLGLGKPSFDAAAQSYIADRTPYERRARYMSILELTWAGGLLVGAPLAGWLIDRFGWEAPFWVVGVLFAITMLAAPALLEADIPQDHSARSRLSLDHTGWALLIAAALFSFAAETTFIVFGAWLEGGFGLSLAALGLASTLIALAEMTGEGAVLAFADRVGKLRMVAWGLGVSAIGYATFAPASTSLPLGLAVLAATFVAFEITIVSTIPLASELAPGARSRYLALLMVALGIGRGIGDLVGPALFTWQGIPANALMSAAGAIAALAVILSIARRSS
ncbi:MAG: MFS transporter [Acidobacteria bacterium]|nr:MFS transporter [Acidobacteriota bacterium]